MKRLFVLLVVVLLLCCGCSKPDILTPALNNISFTAQISYENQEYTADVTIDDGNLNFIINEPEQIKGLTVCVFKNDTTAEFKGVSYATQLKSLPSGAVVQVLYNVLNDVTTKEVAFDDENCIIIGRVNGYKYRFNFSPSGLPLSLAIKDLNLKIVFNNIVIK